MSQEEAANAAGMTRYKYGLIELGRQDPKVEEAASIAKVLNSTIEHLFLSNSAQKMHDECSATLEETA